MRSLATAISLLVALAAWGQRSDDDEAELLVREGRAALTRGSYARAAAALDRALAVDPRRLDAYILRASVHAVKKEYAQGVALMRRATALAPGNVEVATALGTQLLLAGEATEGAAILEQVTAAHPERYQAQAMLAAHHAARGEWRKVIAELTAYLAHRPAALAADDRVHRMMLANAHLRAGHAATARRLFEEILARDPRDLKARLGQAWAAAAIDCREAQPLLEKLQPLAERYPAVLLVRGQCALALGRPQRAMVFADQYLRRQAPPAAGHALRGEALLAGGDAAGARAAYDEALAREPKNQRWTVRLARVERLSGQPERAIARLQSVAGRDPSAPIYLEWHLELADALLAANRAGEALLVGTDLAKLRPEEATSWIVLGAAQLALDDPEGAIGSLSQAVVVDRGSRRARALLGRALVTAGVARLRAGDAARAEPLLARARQVDENDVAALRNLAIAKIALDKPAEALPLLERAARGGRDALTLQLWSRALAMLRRFDEARQRGEAALAAAAGDPPRLIEVALDVAATDLQAGDPVQAAQRLERVLGQLPAALRAQLYDAYREAARAAATRQMGEGAHAAAVKYLERALRLSPRDDAEGVALRCELLLAATAAADRGAAETALAGLGAAPRCPFPAPADELAVPILGAVVAAGEGGRAERALRRLNALERRAGGPAERLLAEATRYVAVRAAADAYARGRLVKARRFLAVARNVPGGDAPELTHDLAVLDLEAGRVDAAVAGLQRVAGDVPEALVNLGLAEERRGNRARALELYQKAAQAPGLRFPPLRDWIAAKQRIYGSSP